MKCCCSTDVEEKWIFKKDTGHLLSLVLVSLVSTALVWCWSRLHHLKPLLAEKKETSHCLHLFIMSPCET